MQVERILRETSNPLRRMFFDPDEMAAWLAEIQTETEASRMRAFLGQGRRTGWPAPL
jgi:hypothetical protein